MLAVTEWALGYALELGSTDLATQVFWANVQYLGIVAMPVAWLIFVLQYTGLEKWLTGRNLALLAVEPLAVLLMVWTNKVHSLIRSNVRLDTSGAFPMLDYTFGPGFWVHVAYSYLLLLFCTLLLIQALFRSPRLYQGQASILLIGALAPWVGNALYIFDLSPFPHLDLTPFAFILTGLALVWGLFRFRLLEIVPVARDAIIDGMTDGVIVLDTQTRIVDLNPAAEHIIGRARAEVIGQSADQMLSGWPDLVKHCHAKAETHADIILGEGTAQRTFDLRSSSLHDRRGRLTGRLIALRDTTERRQTEELLQKERETFFSILQKAPYGVLLIDKDERCLYINPEFANITGQTLDDIPTLADWFPKACPDPAYRKEVIDHWKGDTAQRISRTFSVVCKGGEVKEIEFRPTLLDDGRAIVVLSDITRHKQAGERLRTRERFLECISEVSQQLLRANDLTEVLPAVMRRLGRATEVSRVYLSECYCGPKGELLGSQRYEWCAPGIETQANHQALRNSPHIVSGFASWVEILKRGGIIAGPVADLPESERTALESQDVHSILVIPLFVSDEWYGFIGFDVRDRVREWQQVEIDLLRATASDIASAIERERSRFRAQALAEAAAALTSTLDFDQVLDRILEQVSHVVPNDAANIMLVEGDQATIARWRGYERFGAEEFVSTVVHHIPEMATLQQMINTGEPMVVPNTATDPGWVDAPAQQWLRSYASAPIIVRGQVIGFLNVDSATPGFFRHVHLEPLRAFAGHAAAAIENARLFQAEQRRVRELTLLNRISAGLGAALDVDSMINCVMEGLHELIGADRTYFVTADPEARTWETTHELVAPGIEPGIELSGVFDDIAGALETLLVGQPLAVSDVATDPRVEAMGEMYHSLGVQSFLLVLVQTGRRLHGALGFGYCRQKHTWQPNEVRLLEGAAHQLELAMENARLFEEARLRADELAAALARQEELDRLKDEFIQNVSHELRTPLALVRGYAEMLDGGKLGEIHPLQRRPVAIIARRARMLSDLVQNITLILKTEARPPEPEPVRVDELTRAAIEDFQIATEQAELALHTEIADHLPPVSGSYAYLRRMLDNLLDNAAKFTPAGGTITVRVRQEGEQVALEVSDTGVGIPADRLERIFERFYQVDGSAKRRYGGVGLGLALVKGIVEAYGGRVTVESQIGGGSTFTVFLPVAADTGMRGESPRKSRE
jgi:PAS domain S-box-containing protein